MTRLSRAASTTAYTQRFTPEESIIARLHDKHLIRRSGADSSGSTGDFENLPEDTKRNFREAMELIDEKSSFTRYSRVWIWTTAEFLSALVPNSKGILEAKFHIRYTDPEKTSGRLRVRRWCGTLEENGLTSEMTENLRGVMHGCSKTAHLPGSYARSRRPLSCVSSKAVIAR